MKNRLRFIAIIVLTLATVNHVTGQTTTRFVANFDSDWKFFPGDTTNAYETNFNDNAWRLLDLPPSGKDIIAMIRRDCNHPSIVLWSAGNEIPEQASDNGAEMYKKLASLFHSEDPTRPVTVACDNIAADGKPAKIEFLNLLDIVGYNYVDRWHERRELYYSIDRHDHPSWKMIGTESGSAGSVRANYSLGSSTEVVNGGYNSRMIRAEQLWKFVAINPYVIGDFMWTGIDYLGESRWPSKSASSGIIDLCGFPKDGFFFYKSQWTKEPVLHIFPHWNWLGREGQVIPVLAYTNCDAVELFVNGKSYGEKR